LDTRILEQFVTLADTLHFGRAARACHVSPSALTRSIQRLEDDLGVKLFRRSNREVTLTRSGRRFLAFARDNLGDWEAIRQQLMAESGELQGELAIYCSVTASYSFLFDLLAQFRQAHPRIEIKLHTGDPENAIERVQGGLSDLAIGARPDRLPAGLAFRKSASSPLVFIAANGQPATLGQSPMILPERGLARQRVDAWMANKGWAPAIYAQVAGNEAIVSMVSLGFGIGVVPLIVLENSPLKNKVRVLDARPALKAYHVGLFCQEKRLARPIIQAFWSRLR
jgi:LysR family positive regulator for ilvC